MGANVIYLHSVGAQIWAHPNKLCRGQRHLFCVLSPSFSVFVHFVRGPVFYWNYLPGCPTSQSGRVTALSGKTKGVRICFYINECWRTDVTVLKESRSPLLETLFIDCKPLYWLQELLIHLARVCIPPARPVWVSCCLHLVQQTTNMKLKQPDSLFVFLWDFSKPQKSTE